MGETGASGTSAVAVAAALGVEAVTIRFPGGDLHVRLDGGFAYLTGRRSRARRRGRAVVAHVATPARRTAVETRNHAAPIQR